MLSDRQRGVTCTVRAHEGEGLDDGGVAEEVHCLVRTMHHLKEIYIVTWVVVGGVSHGKRE